ncbi:two-component sensor histidine kinase BarA [Parashewanella curva]|uniref:histidine kinase n=1 Tax=Parashewanella curva TaxID=2338552 RepID=A0A3L8PXQ6_9GAMM|nr:two-component sensor histidine kinase BarA [Parashewanella curva]RLV59589.1 two-component sensor histidine kinase BarA [Parashewanella curva]
MRGAETPPKHNLRTWVLMLALVPTVVIAILLAVFFTVNRTIELEQNILSKTRQVAEPVALAMGLALKSKNRDEAKRLLTSLQISDPELVESIAVFDNNNRRFVSSHYNKGFIGLRHGGSLVTLNQVEQEIHDNKLVIKVPIFAISDEEKQAYQQPDLPIEKPERGPLLGYISVLMNVSDIIEAKHRNIIISFVIILIGIQLNLMFTIRLVKFISGPIDELSMFVSRINSNQETNELSKQYISELDFLKRHIVTMSKTLAASQNEMQTNIEQATSDLVKTLEQIEIQNVELDIAKKRAQDANQTKSEFLANMSHELRTPLNGVIGFAKQLAKTPLHSSQLEYIQTIERSANNLLSIINDILDFSKLEAGKMVIEIIPFSIRDALDETLKLIAPAAHDKHLEFVIDIHEDVPDDVSGDMKHLNQIITNLVGNAIKFTESGSVMVKVELESSHLEQILLRFEVHDTGIGIKPEHQKLLFQAFKQADSSISRRFGGTGLGLIITQRLVEALGGNINFQSELGKGSTFWCILPLERCQLRLGDSLPVANLKNKSVLLCEPNPLAASVTSDILSSWEMLYRVATSPEDVTNKLASSQNFDYFMLSIGDTCNLAKVQKVLQLAQTKTERIILLFNSSKHERLLGDVLNYTDAVIKTPFTSLSLARQMIYAQKTTQPAFYSSQAASPQQKKNLNVLAVDDNPANLMLIDALLNEIVTNVTTASSGEKAIRLAKQYRYDLILMDIQMPDIDGIQATQNIRKDSLNRNTPIVAVTAHSMSEEKERILASGMEDQLQKPIDVSDLQETIERWVNKPSFLQFERHTLNWELCLSQAGHKTELALEMLQMLVKSIPNTCEDIQTTFDAQEPKSMIQIIHKLHGACCYCGVPTTQGLCKQIETALKAGENIKQLEPEILELIDELIKVESAAKQIITQMSPESLYS